MKRKTTKLGVVTTGHGPREEYLHYHQRLLRSLGTNVDVVVRDRHGNPVSGLTKDDFEVYEEGVKQTITNLYEVRRADIAGAQSADASSPDVPVV